MAAAIKFIRVYSSYGGELIHDIVYESGRLRMVFGTEIPQTALKYKLEAEAKGQVKEQYDRYHGYEKIYGGGKK